MEEVEWGNAENGRVIRYGCGPSREEERSGYDDAYLAFGVRPVSSRHAAGGDAAYQALPRPLIFHGFGTALFAFGDAGRQANIAYEIGEMPGARYYSAGGKLVGAVLTKGE